jgi:DNA-binding transcriptional ArsR family regulator
MKTNKSEEFSLRDNRIADFAKALAHPARVAILQILLKRSSCICGDLVDELPIAQSTVSQHLKELKNAGIIKGEIEGTKVCYCLDPENWNEMKKHLGGFIESGCGMGKCC